MLLLWFVVVLPVLQLLVVVASCVGVDVGWLRVSVKVSVLQLLVVGAWCVGVENDADWCVMASSPASWELYQKCQHTHDKLCCWGGGADYFGVQQLPPSRLPAKEDKSNAANA